MNRRIIALLLCAAMAFGLIGCSQDQAQSTETTAAPTPPPTTQPTTADLYQEAVIPIQEAQALELQISVKKTLDIGGEEFVTNAKQEVALSGIGSDSYQGSLTETLEAEGAECVFTEYYGAGMLYATVQDGYSFSGETTAEDFNARFAPAVMLDAALYQDVSTAKTGENTMYIFATPSAGESWALPEDAVFLNAQGTALVDTAGTLCESSYTIEYTYAGIHVTEEYQSTVILTEPAAPTTPASGNYPAISDVDAPRTYALAMLYLALTESVTTSISETIVSQAAACVRTEQTTLNFNGTGNDHVSEVTYNASVLQSGETSTYTQTEHYQDGVYTISADGGEPEASEELTALDMYYYCMDYLVENVISMEYITDIQTHEAGGIRYMEFECSEAMGDALKAYACTVLFEDEALLDNAASGYVPGELGAYLAVDQFTGFPTALGMHYSGTHTIDGADYILTLQTDQSLYLASQTAYETVTGQLPAEDAPENTATPLFYKVTGEDGQEMWLLGTIHLGDARTAYLPQEVYDALNSSDALAVEFDTIAFEEEMTSNAELAAQIAAAYLYTDGTTTKDHLDAEVYEDSIRLLKASGNYTATAEMMKPSIWQQSISNFYIRQGYGLQYEKGVDMRLLKLAKEKDMQILNVESGLAQMQMMGGYSDDLQAFLLEDTLEITPVEYYTESADLFELWCQGDEAALREAMEEDLSELTAEEKVLYDEYMQALRTDRNETMLQVAIDYLESGDTVFYAVGLAHLLSGNGLVDTLQDAGYTVEQVSYN